jgi:hypothetical protein
MPLKAAQKPAAARQCTRRTGSCGIHGGADAEALTAEAMAAEAMPSMQARCQAGPVETAADTLRVRAASAETQT